MLVLRDLNLNAVMDSTMTPTKLVTLDTDSESIAMDVGSTGTRTVLWDNAEGTYTDVLNISSDCKIIPWNLSLSGISLGKAVRDNLEMKISKVGQESTPLYHIIKGSLCDAVQAQSTRLVAARPKSKQEVTPANILSNIAIVLFLAEIHNSKRVADPISVDLTLSSPPDDMQAKSALYAMLTGLSGVYSVEFVKYGLILHFSIDSENGISVYSEPTAAMTSAYVDLNLEEKYENPVVLGIEGGGRSFGFGLIRNGAIIEYTDDHLTQTYGRYGGSLLCLQTAANLAAEYETDPIEPSLIEAALDTGMVRIGNNKYSVIKALDSAKQRICASVVNGIYAQLDRNGLTEQEINVCVCSGRIFGETPSPEYRKLHEITSADKISRSLFDLLQEKFPMWAFERSNKEFPIPSGLVYNRTLERLEG